MTYGKAFHFLQKPRKISIFFTLKVLPIAFLVFFFLIQFFLLPSFAQAAPIGEFTNIKGRVDVAKAGKNARPVKLRDSISVGDIVRTERQSMAEITFIEKSIIRLRSSSRLEISEYLVERDKTKGILKLFRGMVHSTVNTAHKKIFGQGKNNIYEVHTPTAVVGVRGSEFKTFFKNGVSGAIFDKGSGYCFNINLPDILKNINAGQGMLVLDPTKPPVIKPATDPLFQQYMNDSGLMKSGQDVSKGDIRITDKTGKPIDSVVLEIPGEDAPKDRSIEVVKDSHLINTKSEYIVDAKGHKAKTVKGSDLIKKGGVQLRQEPKRFAVVPSSENPEDIGKEVAEAIRILTGEETHEEAFERLRQQQIYEELFDKMYETFLRADEKKRRTSKNQRKEEEEIEDDRGIESVVPYLQERRTSKNQRKEEEEMEDDRGIESVVPYLQPIIIFDVSLDSTETEKSKKAESRLGYIKLESIFSAYGMTESGDKGGSATETTKDMFVFEYLSDDDDIATDGFDDPHLAFRYKVFEEPYWERQKKQEMFLSRPDLFKDIRPDLFKDVTPDDPGVDYHWPVKVDLTPIMAPYFGETRAFSIMGDDPRSIQQSKTFPNDPLFKSRGSWGQGYFDQWGLHRIGFKPSDGKKNSLWPKKAKPVIVAVIDTGIDRTHPEISASLWKNEKEIPGNGIDDDKNGYIDDVYGWNFVDNNNDIRDLNGHGTVTAGIIASLINNRIGIAGVNPFAKIMPIKAMEWDGKGWAFDIAKAIIYAVNNGARVINISIGGKRLNPMELFAVNYARSKGVIVVAAAGNEGINTKEFSPAGLPGVVTVAATGPDNKRVGYSGWGAGVDIAAPGVDILSLRARRTDLLKFEKKNYKPGTAIVGRDKDYYRVTGTSFSAPFVSGVASLILAKNPKLSGMQATRMILHSANDIDMPGWDQFTGYGLLDASAALKADPDFYVLSRIFKVGGTKKEGKFYIEVSGRAMADNFKRAWIEAGKGNNPTEWVKVSDDITAPINRGQLALILPKHFRGEKQWTLRLIVEHQNGFKRESRFSLKLG